MYCYSNDQTTFTISIFLRFSIVTITISWFQHLLCNTNQTITSSSIVVQYTTTYMLRIVHITYMQSCLYCTIVQQHFMNAKNYIVSCPQCTMYLTYTNILKLHAYFEISLRWNEVAPLGVSPSAASTVFSDSEKHTISTSKERPPSPPV